MLKVTKLNKYYYNFGRKPLHVIDNTSLEIPKTGIIAVVGQSGAGKTTLINTISGLDSFRSGEIAFEDIKMRHYNNHVADKLRMKNFGFIFQNYYLLEDKSVYENVKISIDSFDISEAEKKKRIHYVLNQLGIAKYTNKKVTSLSGGEQQRVSIARALVKSPSVIFADEPTGSLDEKTTFNVLNILKKISKSCAVFIVTHEREIISYYADYIIEIENGLVVKEFTPVTPEGKSLSVDQNIYLKELDHRASFEKEDISFDIYSDKAPNGQKSKVKIAYKEDKIYLEASEGITILDSKSENHLIDDKPRKIEDYVDDNFSFELEPLNTSKNRTGFKEILKRGYRNFKIKRPIKRLLKVMCLTLSIILMGLLEGANSLSNVDLSGDLSASKGNLYLTIEPAVGDSMSLLKMQEAYDTVTEEVEKSSLNGAICYEPRDTLVYFYNGFFQVQNKRFPLPLHDFKPLSFITEKDLSFGRLPEQPNEVVVDEYILENFIETSLLKTVITDYGHFVGKTLISNNYRDNEFVISGVSRTKSPTMFGFYYSDFTRMSYDSRAKVIDIDMAKKVMVDNQVIQGSNLEPGHCILNRHYGASNADACHFVIDEYLDTMDYDIIINPNDYSVFKKHLSSFRTKMYIATDGKTETINGFKNLISDLKDQLEDKDVLVKLIVENRYQDEYNTAVGTFENILFVVKIVAGVVTVIALLFIILSTYFSMLSQIGDIAVYRSLGYSRANLGLTYFIELFLTTFIYVLLGLVITYGVLFIIDVIPIIDFHITTMIWQFLVVFAGLLGIILFIGLLPILIVFRRTPANLYNRFHRRIENI